MWSYFLLICFEWLKRTKPPSDLKQRLLWAKNVHFLSGLHFRDFTKLQFAVWKPKMMITWVHFIAKALLDCIRWNCCEVGFGVCLPRVPGGNLVDVLGRVQDVAVCRGHAVQRKCLLSALVPHMYSYYKYFTFNTPSPTPRPSLMRCSDHVGYVGSDVFLSADLTSMKKWDFILQALMLRLKKVQFKYVKYKVFFFLFLVVIYHDIKKNVNLLEVFKVHTCVFFNCCCCRPVLKETSCFSAFFPAWCVCVRARVCVCVCVLLRSLLFGSNRPS